MHTIFIWGMYTVFCAYFLHGFLLLEIFFEKGKPFSILFFDFVTLCSFSVIIMSIVLKLQLMRKQNLQTNYLLQSITITYKVAKLANNA